MKSGIKALSAGKQSAIVAIGLFAVIGTYALNASFAAYSHNPIGSFDYCALVSGKTVIYGWAHDPDAPAGAQPSSTIKVTGQSNKTVTSGLKYRDTAINTYLKSKGIPTSSIYGWSASYSGLYKGTAYTLSGTGINVGTGANAALLVNKTKNVDGDTSKPYFVNGIIPDACLVAKPTPTPAPPPPVPAPTPTPTTPTPTPVATPKKTVATTPATPAAVPVAVSDAADATLIVGTTTTKVIAPLGNAEKVQIKFGTDTKNLNLTADAVNDITNATASLTSLTPQQTYYYQIVRTRAATITTSSADNFKTKGYAVTLAVTDNTKRKIANTEIAIPELNIHTKTDDSGVAILSDIPAGQYTLQLKLNSGLATQTFSIPGEQTPTADATGVLSANIDVSVAPKAAPADAAQKAANKKKAVLLLAAFLCLLLAAMIIVFAKKRGLLTSQRRRGYRQLPFQPTPIPTPRSPYIPQQPQVPRAPILHGPVQAPGQNDLHVGESLKDMVIKSMREEAERRRQQGR